MKDKPPLRVGLAGLGAVGLEVAKRQIAGVPGLTLAAVAVRDVEKARRAGIYIPIVPGILPVHNFAQVANFSARAGTLVPAWLAERFDGLDKDPQTHALVSAAVAAEQVLDLVERGVGDFHFYTMNRADLAFAICHMIGIRGDLEKASSAAA